MDPTTIALILGALVKYGPDAAEAIRDLFKKPDPTLDDWDKIFSLSRKSYDDYVKPKL